MMCPFVWEYLLTFWPCIIYQVHLVLFLSQLQIKSFLQGALVPFSGEWYLETKIWVLDILFAIRYHCS